MTNLEKENPFSYCLLHEYQFNNFITTVHARTSIPSLWNLDISLNSNCHAWSVNLTNFFLVYKRRF